MNHLKIIAFLLLIVSLQACRPATPVPKPKGYFKIDLPEHQYRTFDSTGFPFSFEYPVYGNITQDAALNKEEGSPYWLNIEFKEMDAAIYLSYKSISAKEPIDKLIEESYHLSYAHDIRADYIKKTPEFQTKNGLRAVFYSVGGNAASAYQFYITDQKQNFARGALYFNVTPNADSLRPSAEFLRKDMEHLLETMKFK